MAILTILFVLSVLGNIIQFFNHLIQKSHRKMMEARYENAMEEIQRIRANYNELLNQSNQDQ